jgi:hypothetical protein
VSIKDGSNVALVAVGLLSEKALELVRVARVTFIFDVAYQMTSVFSA